MTRRAGAHRERLVTLTSDVGSAYAAQMVAALVAAGVSPDRLLDLAHDLPVHAVPEAAFLVREMVRAFPPDAVHVVVVDPGVGGHRKPIVVVTRKGPLLVGPDNGVLVPTAEEQGFRGAYAIDPNRLRRAPRVGSTFDGRDLFAPAAAQLANGARPSSLGPPVPLAPFHLPEPRRTRSGARGEVLHVDRFGNLITNVPTLWVPATVASLGVRLGGGRAHQLPWTTSYEALGRRKLGALGSSFGLVEVAVGEGAASRRLGARVGTPVELRWDRHRLLRGEKPNSARPRKRR